MFFDGSMVDVCKSAGSWPTDAKKLKNSSFTEGVVDLDIAIDSEVKELAGLKKYRVFLNRFNNNDNPDVQ